MADFLSSGSDDVQGLSPAENSPMHGSNHSHVLATLGF